MKPSIGWGCVAGAWVLAAVLSSGVKPNDYREGRSRDPRAQVEMNQSSLARILGEFRTGASDMLFIKTERYLHSGVGYVPHLTEDLLTVEGADKGVDSHLEEMDHEGHDHDHEGHDPHDDDPFHHEEEAETLLPTEESDYRGWIGRTHRKVKPFLDPSVPHRHTDGKELIPWFRLMTLSDPGYVRGYLTGSFWVKRHDWEAAMMFLEEGLEKNPEAFQLHMSMGYLYMQRARSISEKGAISFEEEAQRPLLIKAKEAFRRAGDLAVQQRPPEPEEGDIDDHPDWGRYLENDARGATNMAVFFEKNYGDPAEGEAMRKRYLETMPSNKLLTR